MNSMNTFDNIEQSSTSTDLNQNKTIAHSKSGNRFRCIKCHGNDCDFEIIQIQPDGISKLTHKKNILFKAISCTNCGYTEFFKVKVERPTDPLGFIDFNN